eukprot:NODE_1898_length_1363_cov_41.645358_g1718_i0.p1 GENE.NODE_1898_length_1363_cov_41.645358_g1718_i0~~NODE_1898_length_1363_cov_41.645358_g1718_i0.p1  ORF type:complete len:351 (-),score=106.33 NODE_1898_length_1363_cov_41.645358_g1718_i0:310-1257(-)
MATSGIDCVQLDGHVLLKIINHSEVSLPAMATGQLLGLDVESTLEVTASFPFISRSDESSARNMKEKEQRAAEQEAEARDYQFQMMSHLREVNVDSNTVGWYCSAWLEYYLTPSVIETQYEYQKELGDNCVVLIYDPLKTTHGKVWIKAFRLNKKFMELYKSGDFTQEVIREKRLTSKDVLDEVPLVIRNNPLVDIFIGELSQCRDFFGQSLADEPIELDITGYVTQSLEGLVEGVEELQQAQQRYNHDQKRWKQAEQYGGSDQKPPRPSKLESLLIGKQLEQHCEHLNNVAASNFENLFFAERLQKAGERSDAQ